MPTYEYECQHCGHRFEKFQSITDAALKKCPACGKRALRRLIGAGAGVIFKGSGFYQTDYRSDAYRKSAEKEKPGGKEKSAKKAAEDAPADKPKTESKNKEAASD
jgi:putative FmdB family regulatory protein